MSRRRCGLDDWFEDVDDGIDDYDEEALFHGDADEDEENEWGCCFPDRCLMHCEHQRWECFDAEMAAAWNAEQQGPVDLSQVPTEELAAELNRRHKAAREQRRAERSRH